MATTLSRTAAAPRRRLYQLAEYETAVIRCSAATASEMDADGHVSVSPGSSSGRYKVRARHKVGVLHYGDLELRIVPKVPVARLLYLATYRDDPDVWRPLDTMLDDIADPLSAIGHALAFHAERALQPAPLQGYRTHEESSRSLRGRVLFERQLSVRAGVLIPVEVRFDEYEIDVAENQVLKAALEVLGRYPLGSVLSRRINHLKASLDGVQPWLVGRAVPDFEFNRLNERYKPALALARLVLDRRSLDYPESKRRGTAFLLNMNAVFESYLGAVLRKELERRHGRVRLQYGTTLDLADNLGMKPDLTWWSGQKCIAVLDAKYKRTTSTEFPNADAYQMLAYCTRLGLRRGFLAYADLGESEAHVSVVRNAGVEIVVCSLDISGSISELHGSATALAERVAVGSRQ